MTLTNALGGKVWKFGDDINTDLMLPGPLLTGTEAEQARAVFAANRPGWVDQIGPGDIIVGGRNFGTGSSRPAARSLRNIGLGSMEEEYRKLLQGGGKQQMVAKEIYNRHLTMPSTGRAKSARR